VWVAEVIIHGDALTELKKLESGIAQTCITSPPYWGLRDYGCDGQLGLEPSPEEYVTRLVEIFAEVKRVLRDDGTLWLVLGDSYTSGNRPDRDHSLTSRTSGLTNRSAGMDRPSTPMGTKPKDLVGIPWRVAFALQADGWYLRSDIIWAKPNPMPESVTDRPTSAHEHIFLLAKSQRYFYDADAVAEESLDPIGTHRGGSLYRAATFGIEDELIAQNCHRGKFETILSTGKRNKRNVWTVVTQPYPEAHFAVFPPALIEPCVLAGSAEGDIVLDPFLGSGTTAEVALKHRRKFIGIELNPEYVELAEKRLREVEVVMF
jgi:site-specific DNA-methyltransferase (adenine-specific)